MHTRIALGSLQSGNDSGHRGRTEWRPLGNAFLSPPVHHMVRRIRSGLTMATKLEFISSISSAVDKTIAADRAVRLSEIVPIHERIDEYWKRKQRTKIHQQPVPCRTER